MELGVLFGLGSAAAFGAGDFSGGLASRRVSGLHGRRLAQVIGLVLLLVLLAILRPTLPSTGRSPSARRQASSAAWAWWRCTPACRWAAWASSLPLSGVGSVALPLLVGFAFGRAPDRPRAQWLGVGGDHGGGRRRQRRHATGRAEREP